MSRLTATHNARIHADFVRIAGASSSTEDKPMSSLQTNTIIHGDCLQVLKSLPEASIDAIITDPPYGIDYHATRRKDKARWFPKIANDRAPFIWWLHEAARVLKPDGALLCFTRFDTEEAFRFAMRLAGLAPKAQVIWDKRL